MKASRMGYLATRNSIVIFILTNRELFKNVSETVVAMDPMNKRLTASSASSFLATGT